MKLAISYRLKRFWVRFSQLKEVRVHFYSAARGNMAIIFSSYVENHLHDLHN